jgi:predicted nucleic acid-binding protein
LVNSQPNAFFKKHRKVYLDTSVFIYFVEHHPLYYDLCDEIFRDIEEGRIEAATSTLTLTEILVQPYRLKKEELVLKFYSLFTTYPHLRWIQLTLGISDLAAKLRAEHNLKTPDAIQIASALANGATGFVCNDKAFRKAKDIDCLILGDLV